MTSRGLPPGRRRGSGPARGATRVPAWATWAPAAVALALYARTLGFAFVWDDLDLVVRNGALHADGWVRLLADDFWRATGGGTGMWRPLVTASYRLDGVLGGWQPATFHAVNVLAYAAAALLVGRLATSRGAPPRVAALAGIVFATAPALSESVAWVAGRTDVFLVLGTLGALLLARRWRARGDRVALAGSLACAAAALLAKETALVLPLLLAAEAWDGGAAGEPAGARGRRAWPALAALALVIVWAVAHRALVPPPAHPGEPGAAGGLAALALAPLAWLLPGARHVPLLAAWTPPAAGIAALAWLACAGLAALAALAARRRVPALLPLALLVLPLLPVAAASLVESGFRFAERTLALPAVGFALGLASLATAARGRARTAAVAVLAALGVAQVVAAWPAIGAWRDEEARLTRIAHLRPDDPDALLGLADLLSTEGREAEARVWIERAAAVPGHAGDPDVALASLEFRAGRFERALTAAERAVAADPRDLAAGYLKVRALARLGRAEEAVRAGEALLAAHPGEAPASGALGEARLAAGDAAGAMPLLRLASEHLLDDAGLAWDLGRAAIATGDIALAREAFERAVRAEPALYEGWLGVADTRARTGDRRGAEEALARAEALPGAADGRAQRLRARIEGEPTSP